ncbi:hypothetical protein KC19_11G132800 [Ceratodon purpureus]|uniref:AB hydrolase-1 domain-containing protein n=1 Tax=Ceratodon purpureus TaxID=3225 RepID=A0A8T0GDG9_CERPU|nr:hypothetical protein KC19_11G132800 [Ceratodon purpureus]
MATSCKSWILTPMRGLDVGRIQQPGLQSWSSGVSFSKAQRLTVMAGMAAARTPLKLEKVVLTKRQIEEAKHEMDKFVQNISGHPEKRENASPYYLLHEAGQAVYGTVLMFHGFSATTWQTSLLAQYLFDNGFNVYQPSLCGHYFVNPDKNWPKHDFKKVIKEKLVKKLKGDPELAAYIQGFISISLLTPEQAKVAVDRLKALNENELLAAVSDDEFGDAFSEYYESEHLRYLHEAEQRMQEVAPLPGPLFTVGMSMGGATAIALAAIHPDKVARTAVFAPFFKSIDDYKGQFCKLTGPLGCEEKGWYPDMPFLLSCMVEVGAFGHFVRQDKHLNVLAKLPTFIVQTEIDDCADHAAGLRIIKEIEARSGAHGPPHFSTLYSAAEGVPHPMVHPLEASFEGGTNKFWQSLYQETFRFLTEGTVDVDHLHVTSQDPALPQVQALKTPALSVA